MNKHIKTLVGFKNGTKSVAKDCFYDLWDALDEILSAFKKIGFVIFAFMIWILSLALICILPLATWLRVKWERDAEIESKKAAQEYADQMTCLHNNRGINDQHLNR
ncbi:hypothetical protein GFH30_06345 [Acinetobacter wanghuae]|uniref:DUF3742 family protein n=1 Tax=Acinetobacter wanghuae TaxID=2662362 RepID=A0ABX6D0J7_9GAMM|nr:hypothetical protein [Acinetobacter wanghuae]QGA11032.1 hypothetical protein GFH30_06345 [Acinetobacter wanghuae]